MRAAAFIRAAALHVRVHARCADAHTDEPRVDLRCTEIELAYHAVTSILNEVCRLMFGQLYCEAHASAEGRY